MRTTVIMIAVGLAIFVAAAMRPGKPVVKVPDPERVGSAQPVSPKTETKAQAAPLEAPPAVEEVAPAGSATAVSVDHQRTNTEQRSTPSTVPVSPVVTQSNTPRPTRGGKGKPPIQDPGAREALHLVGADPRAEKYWLRAINDPALPAQERQDLIEDLNETGLQDPQHPTDADLPVIVSRMSLIESEADHAMDEVNADAFAEAYKDLKNLFDAASGKREPAR